MSIQKNWQSILEKIKTASKKSGRNAEDIQVVAVTKTHSDETVFQAIQSGIFTFGENYVQEAVPKIEAISKSQQNVKWHFIGHLQTNKVRSLIGKVDMIHSVDRESLLNEIAKRAEQLGHPQKILLEVNLANEESKNGVSVENLNELVRLADEKKSIQLCGLMFMPPLDLNEKESRDYFNKARILFENTKKLIQKPEHFVELSMGTSHDFEIAIECGATLVRLGTVLFGERSKNG